MQYSLLKKTMDTQVFETQNLYPELYKKILIGIWIVL